MLTLASLAVVQDCSQSVEPQQLHSSHSVPLRVCRCCGAQWIRTACTNILSTTCTTLCVHQEALPALFKIFIQNILQRTLTSQNNALASVSFVYVHHGFVFHQEIKKTQILLCLCLCLCPLSLSLCLSVCLSLHLKFYKTLRKQANPQIQLQILGSH